MIDKAVSDAIVSAIKELSGQIMPDVHYLPKYGGEVLALDPDDDGKFVAGVFAYKDHVSLEFSNGASFDDPDGHLEGKGKKKRRHLKFRSLEDDGAKDACGFLKQAMS